MKSWVEKNAIEMYSTHNEGKSVVAERFIRTLKNKIYKYMASVSKTLYTDKLDDIVNKYNNTYSTVKMKAVDVKSNTYNNSSKEINDKDPKFKISDTVRISKYENIFSEGYILNQSEEVFVIKRTKKLPVIYVFSDLKGEEITGTFYKKELQKNKANRVQSSKSNKEKL